MLKSSPVNIAREDVIKEVNAKIKIANTELNYSVIEYVLLKRKSVKPIIDINDKIK
jgi:hypothetical protein